MDKKMWEIYYWLRNNFRLYNSEIGRQVGLNPFNLNVKRVLAELLNIFHTQRMFIF